MKYKVLIVEDQSIPRELFKIYIDSDERFEHVLSISNASAALSVCRNRKVDLILMDVMTELDHSGLDATEEIKKEFPAIKVIIVTSMPELSYERQAHEIGIESFWQKEVQEQSIQEIMDRTMAGESVYPGSHQKVNIGEAVSTEFTEREVDILKELVSGASNAEIAEKLGLKEPTVKMHIKNMLQKTGYRSRLELAVKVRHMGLIIGDLE